MRTLAYNKAYVKMLCMEIGIKTNLHVILANTWESKMFIPIV